MLARCCLKIDAELCPILQNDCDSCKNFIWKKKTTTKVFALKRLSFFPEKQKVFAFGTSKCFLKNQMISDKLKKFMIFAQIIQQFVEVIQLCMHFAKISKYAIKIALSSPHKVTANLPN